MSAVIQVENLSKLYRLGEVSTGTLSHDINRWWHRVRGKEDPYTKIGQVNDRTRKAASPDDDYVWALKDINFSVAQGEVLGIIGRNGAGKSTLLKILSRVTAPTAGSIKVKGRIASLLEVGTGFHPELTGRENIFLNGAILGMRRHEIASKLDEIVDFSGCAAYLDTPVKRYSSGMYVRLAFAVAAHLEPEILVVDEVLAVGDADFQRRCLGKMKRVADGGRTVLFVSHNMGAVQNLCSSVLHISEGRVAGHGADPERQIADYLGGNQGGVIEKLPLKVSPSASLTCISVEPSPTVSGGPCEARIEFESSLPQILTDCALLLFDEAGRRLSVLDGRATLGLPRELPAGGSTLQFRIPAFPVVPGVYRIGCFIKSSQMSVNHFALAEIRVTDRKDQFPAPYPLEHRGTFEIPFEMKLGTVEGTRMASLLE